MNVRVRIQFASPGHEELSALQSLARRLTNNPSGVRVYTDAEPGWLVAEFTMPTEPQYAAVPKIDQAIRFWASDRTDVRIGFPMTEAERARARRKAERRRSRRRSP